MSYFIKHKCPSRFSLTSEEAENNDFYEVHIYIPEGDDAEIETIPKKDRGLLDVSCEFIPDEVSNGKSKHIKGKAKKRDDNQFSEYCLQIKDLKFARIDVYYYFKYWSVREDKCSIFTLTKLYILRALGLIHIQILLHKIHRYLRRRKVNKRLRMPLRSKFELYEALMESDLFLRTGTFRKSELSKLIFGEHSAGEFSVYQKINKSLDWILESCIEDEEIQQVSYQGSQDPIYKVKGKGINYFTLTKENIKREAESQLIQRQQVKIQKRMTHLTFLLVIVTLLAGIDKIDYFQDFFTQVFVYLESIREFIKFYN